MYSLQLCMMILVSNLAFNLSIVNPITIITIIVKYLNQELVIEDPALIPHSLNYI